MMQSIELLSRSKQIVQFHHLGDPCYCYFDYDVRSSDINMNFQHFHTFYELFILMDDSASHFMEGSCYDLQKFDIVLLPPSMLHKTQYPPGPPRKRVIIHFSPQFVPAAMAEEFHQLLGMLLAPVPIYRFAPEDQRRLIKLIDDIFTVNRTESIARQVNTYHMLLQFLTTLWENRMHNAYQNTRSDKKIADKIYNICSYIHRTYAQPLTLQTLSKEFYISESYLSRQFLYITGFHLTEYIQRTRLHNAQQNLIITGDRITEIAEQCGFSSFSQFNRVFRKYNEVSPSQYRRQNMQKSYSNGIVDGE